MACWAALGGTALAEGDKGGPTSWTFPYALVMLFIGLGLLMVLNPTRRRQREKPEQYVGKKTLIDED
jgi:hypothetical protein